MFAVDSVAARDAIEQAMPRLRELLEQGGLQLSHSEVADHSQSQKEQSQIDEGLVGDNLSSEPEEDGEGVETWQLGVASTSSTVDYYI
jgi:flagellar hook-length control protein FliK